MQMSKQGHLAGKVADLKRSEAEVVSEGTPSRARRMTPATALLLVMAGLALGQDLSGERWVKMGKLQRGSAVVAVQSMARSTQPPQVMRAWFDKWCSCEKNTCGCCMAFGVFSKNLSACVDVTSIDDCDDFTGLVIDLRLKNSRGEEKTRMTMLDETSVCQGLLGASGCMEPYGTKLWYGVFRTCLQLSLQAGDTKIVSADLDCVKISSSGIEREIPDDSERPEKGLLNKVADWIQQNIQGVRNWFNAAHRSVIVWVKGAAEDTRKWFEKAGLDTKEWFEKLGEDTKNWFDKAGQDTKDWFEKAGKDTKDWFEKAGDDVADWFKNVFG